MGLKIYQKGDVIFRKGDTANCMFDIYPEFPSFS